MSKTVNSNSLFERLRKGLEEGIQFAQGDRNLTTVEVVAPPPKWSGKEIVRLRKQFQMSQKTFSQLLNVSLKTVQGWEQGEHKPSQAALRLLQLLKARPEMVGEVVRLS